MNRHQLFQGNSSLTVQESTDPNLPGELDLSLTQTGNETYTASMSGSYYTNDNDGQGNITTNKVTAGSSLLGSDTFVLTLQGWTFPGEDMVVDLSSLQASGQQTSTSSQGFNTNWATQAGSTAVNGYENTSQTKQDQLSYNFTVGGHLDPTAGWLDDPAPLLEQALETFAYSDAGRRSLSDQTSTMSASASATFQGQDGFTLTQNATQQTLDRFGSGQYTVAQASRSQTGPASSSTSFGPGTGADNYSIHLTLPVGNGTGSQGGTGSVNWAWPDYVLIPAIPPYLALTTPDQGSETLGWGPHPGDGMTGSNNPLGFVGQSFAEGVLAAANGPPVAAADHQTTAGLFTTFVGKMLNQTAADALESSADQVTLWVAQMRTGQAAWQGAHSQMLAAVQGHFVSDARWKAVNIAHIWVSPNAPWQGDWLRNTINFVGGVTDSVTGGLTAYVRNWIGLDSVVDMNSTAYRVGSQVGRLANIVLMVTPLGALGTTMAYVQIGLQAASIAGAAVSFVAAWQNGNVEAVIQGILQVGLSAVVGVSACMRQSAAAACLQRLMLGINAGQAVVASIGAFAEGDWFGGLVNLAEAGASLYMMGCFAAGTPLLTPGGSKVIEAFQRGDEILARSEFDLYGPVEVKRVEEVFVNMAPIVHLHVGGQVIRTTAEHPFYVYNKGWLAVRELTEEDWLCSQDGQWLPVEEVFDTGEYEKVYNVRVADFHTYFIGSRDWGFSVWSHNACNNPYGRRGSPEHRARIDQAEQALNGRGWTTASGGSLREARVGVGSGRYRYPDLVMRKGNQEIAVQVGQQNAAGQPVTREVQALTDLRNTGRFSHVFFLGY